MGAQLYHRDLSAERVVRPNPRPYAGDPAAEDMATVAWRGGCGARTSQGDAEALSGGRHDTLAREHSRRQRTEQRSVADRADRAGSRIVVMVAFSSEHLGSIGSVDELLTAV